MERPKKTEYPIIGTCDVFGNTGMELYPYKGRYLSELAWIEQKDKEEGEKQRRKRDKLLDDFRDIINASSGTA